MHDYLNDMLQHIDIPQTTPIVWDPHHIKLCQAYMDQCKEDINSGYGITDDEQEKFQKASCMRNMLVRWHTGKQDPELKQMVEACMRFLPEERPSAAKLLAQLELVMPSKVSGLAQLYNMGPEALDEATRAFTTESDLPAMQPGNLDVERDERFWRRLRKYYQWIDHTAGNIRPPLDMNDNNIPGEVKDMFYPGYREAQNRLLAQQAQDVVMCGNGPCRK